MMTGLESDNILFPFFSRLNTRVFFMLVFILELLLIFQGLDLSDEGFLSIFYRRIFSNPVAVSYNFMFWLTGIIGGIWAKIFSPLGLLGIRLGGAVINTVTVVLTYHLLKKYLNTAYLKIGLLMVVLSLNNDIKVINYNTLSSLFYVITVFLLFNGLQKGQSVKIIAAGFFAGLNIFIRTPNILELGLVTGIWYYGFLSGATSRNTVKQILAFLAGYLAAVGSVMVCMRLMGHLQIYFGSLKLLYSMGKGVKNPDVQGGYGLARLINLFRSNITESVKFAIIPIVVVFGSLFLLNAIKLSSNVLRLLLSIASGLAVILLVFLIMTDRIDHFTMLFTLTGLVLICIPLIFVSSLSKEIKVLFFFGVFFLCSFPLGSSDGVFTAGRYCLWIGLPIAIDYLLKFQSSSLTSVIVRDDREYSRKLWVTESQFTNTKRLMVLTILFAGFYYLYYYPFFDRKNRVQMRFALESNNLKGIYTSKGRADAFNELLRESTRYVRPNSYVIAYDNIAMFYYATNTIPLLTNPLPAVYSAELFKSDLNSMTERSPVMPPVIMQEIATVGDASKWPEEIMPGDYLTSGRNLDKNTILDSFLVRNNYREVWANKVFKIMLPDSSLPSKK
jgi:Dolichyl-phosphate-mannose-protein mannosyltransferase